MVHTTTTNSHRFVVSLDNETFRNPRHFPYRSLHLAGKVSVFDPPADTYMGLTHATGLTGQI